MCSQAGGRVGRGALLVDGKTSRYRKRTPRSIKEDDQCDVMVGNEIQGSDEESISSKPPDHPTREGS